MSSINFLHSVSYLICTQRQRYAWQIYRLSLFLLLVTLGNLATAGTFTAYGPETSVRTAGAPNSYDASFSVLNPNTGYTLNIYNGGVQQSGTAGNSVQAAQVYLNGQIVANSNVFKNKKSPLITIPVTVQETNQLTVVLEGKPGGQLTLEIIGVDNDSPVITATGAPTPNPADWNNSSVTVSFECSDTISGIATCSDPVSVDEEGANRTVNGTATDNAGNTATASLTLNIDKTPPDIMPSLSPPPNAAGWNNADVTVSFTATDTLSGIAEVTDPILLTTEGASQEVAGTAADAAGNSASTTATVNLDKTPPQLSISSPADGSDVITDNIEVTGTATDNTSIARVIVNGVDATLNGDSFSAVVPLSEGDNSITITAFDQADNEASTSLSVAYVFPVTIQIIEPATLITVGSTPIEVNGSVSDPAASLTVNGAPVDNGNGTFTAQVSLEEGLNTIVARAVNSQGAEVTDSIVVSMDLTPPYITVESPLDGQTVGTAAVSVSGLVNDIVRGTIAEDQANVLVNGIQATVSNRSYLAENIPLQTGDNQITVSASDQVGNTATTSINVRYEPPALRHIELASGQGQQAQIRSALPDPLTVRLIGNDGQPVPANNVVFRVIQGDGVLQVGADSPAQGVLAVTNGDGIAQAAFNLGSRSGVGNHRVRATAVGFDSEVIFHASANANPGDKVSVNSGNNQRGAINQPLPQPFVVAVTDEGANVVQGAQVEFGVTRGGGKFQNDATTYTTQTDSDGRATAHLTLGSEVGFDVHRVSATLVGTSLNAGFTASALQTGDAGNTRITGVVFDNQDTPLPGVTIRVDGTTRQAETNEQGQFLITEVPVGPVHLLADGSTTTAAGEWPTLSYNLVTIAGAENPLPSPVYMVRLDTENAVLVGAADRIITLPELPGFELEVRAGSVTFPDGSHEGLMSVTPVNADKVPMAPPNGMQPQFIVTIQPTGTRFDPPAPLTLPNVDGHLPGAQVEMYSYDHDLEEFVSIGLGTVSTDGSVIRSNNGIGVIKAGWHCGSQPTGQGCADACPICQDCNGDCNCVAAGADPRLASLDVAGDCKKYRCNNGSAEEATDDSDEPDNKCCLNGELKENPIAENVSGVSTVNYIETSIAPTSGSWGEMVPVNGKVLEVDISAYYEESSDTWKAKVTKADSTYSIWYRNLAGGTASAANATAINCSQMISDLQTLGVKGPSHWYTVDAVEAHERVHVQEWKSSLNPKISTMKTAIENLSVPHACGKTGAIAKAELKAEATYSSAILSARNDAVVAFNAIPDPNASTRAAERAVVNPIISAIKAKGAVNSSWPAACK